MKWSDVENGVWTIASVKREKGHANELKLPKVALDIINAQPHFASNPYVFASRGSTQLQNHTVGKAVFVAKLPDMPQWQLHDLRRTARSLMSRAGVLPHISERVLGHTMGGVEGIYDRHKYDEEKAHALNALAALIERIVNPPAENVVSLEARAL